MIVRDFAIRERPRAPMRFRYITENPEGSMRKTLVGLSACAAVTALACGSASAFPAAPLPGVATPVEQVRLVCDDWGNCRRTGPRYYRYGYYGPRHHYGPRYGYYHRPGVTVGAPGFGLHFGF